MQNSYQSPNVPELSHASQVCARAALQPQEFWAKYDGYGCMAFEARRKLPPGAWNWFDLLICVCFFLFFPNAKQRMVQVIA